MRKLFIAFIDQFYFLLRWLMPLQTYRYAVCGGSNLVLDMVLYFICYNFIFTKTNVDLHLVVLSPHIASLFFVFPITFTTGFMLNRYVTFQNSELPWRVQFTRYFVVGMGAIVVSYLCMKLLVDGLRIYPTPSRLITILITVVYSYLLQSRYSFRAGQ